MSSRRQQRDDSAVPGDGNRHSWRRAVTSESLQDKPMLRRCGSFSALNLEGEVTLTINDRIEALGVGPYQLLVVVCIGFLNLSESLDMGAVGPLHAALERVYVMSDHMRAALPTCVYAGSMIGLFIAGPLSDQFGRKAVLFVSQLVLVLAAGVTAMLPRSAPVWLILLIRFVNGAAGAASGPPALALASESSPERTRSKVIFAITFFGSLGYLCEAFGVQLFMRHFGEDPSDNWRAFCWYITIPAIVSLPLILMLCESPAYLAITGNAERCSKALDSMAWWNGKPRLMQQVRIAEDQLHQDDSEGFERSSLLWNLWATILIYPFMIFVLFCIDGFKSFMLSGSSYLWKDLFAAPSVTGAITPSTANTIASVAPMVGLVLTNPLVDRVGIRATMISCSLVASTSLAMVTIGSLRSDAVVLLVLVVLVKLTYGPLSACVSLMKLQAFPTAVRASIFSFISFAGRLLCLVAPTLIEVLRGGPASSDWTEARLEGYVWSLIGTVLAAGFGSLFVRQLDDVKPLEDFVDAKRAGDLGRRAHLGQDSKKMLDSSSVTSSFYGSVRKVGGTISEPNIARP